MRYAIYFTPPRDSPLTRLAASWLGRDPFNGASVAAAVGDRADAWRNRLPHRRGAPLWLSRDAEGAVSAGGRPRPKPGWPRPSPNLRPASRRSSSRALPSARSTGSSRCCRPRRLPELDALAGDVVKAFDRFRSPLTEAEIERRNPDALSAEEFRNLCQWGYPYVFDAFRFHMTLTGRVAAGEAPRVRAALDEVFGAVLAEPVAVDGVALFVEPEAGAPFTIHSWRGFEPRRHRKTA